MKLKSILLVTSGILMFGNSSGQTKVTTGALKYTLVEEGTGTWCQWCPDGAQVIQEKLLPYGTAGNFPRVIVASFHNGSSDKMTLPGDPYNVGTGYITGFPGGTVDRTAYAPQGTAISVYRRYWPDAVAVRDALTPNFKVSMECLYDPATRKISIKVTAKVLAAVTGSYHMNAYIVEDSIASNLSGFKQTSASGLNNPGSLSESGSPSWFIGKGLSLADSMVYSHMDVVRKVLATDSIWGDAAFNNPVIGDSITKTYSYTIPASINGALCQPKYTKVIGLVQKYGTSTSDRSIENAIKARVRYMQKSLSITEVKTMENIELYPNPAASYINVQGTLSTPSATTITIINTLGQVVSENVYPAGSSLFSENISLANLSNGTYIMNIINDGERVVRKFTINK
jgi:hypothetical protein